MPEGVGVNSDVFADPVDGADFLGVAGEEEQGVFAGVGVTGSRIYHGPTEAGGPHFVFWWGVGV